MRCLAHAPADRFSDMAGVLRAIERTSHPPRARHFGARFSGPSHHLAAFVLGAAALLGGSGVLALRDRGPSRHSHAVAKMAVKAASSSILAVPPKSPFVVGAAPTRPPEEMPMPPGLSEPRGRARVAVTGKGLLARRQPPFRSEGAAHDLTDSEKGSAFTGGPSLPESVPLALEDAAVSPLRVRRPLHPDDIFDPYQQ
jgi:hypothetical protein